MPFYVSDNLDDYEIIVLLNFADIVLHFVGEAFSVAEKKFGVSLIFVAAFFQLYLAVFFFLHYCN